MADIPSELIYHRKWWWDPIDMEVFKALEEDTQRDLVAISLQTQAEMLRVQAAGYEKIGAAIARDE